MANLKESDLWEGGIYQLEEEDPVLGGPDGVDNLPPRQLANRTRYQRLRNITPWDPGFDYPAGAYVHHGGTTWRSVGPNTNAAPGDKAGRWERWGHSSKELMDALNGGVAAHEQKADPHPVYALRDSFAAVPEAYMGHVITINKPHLRQMVWDGSKYVRAPWHQPGMVQYSYDNPPTIPGYLPIRADLVYRKSDYPDLVERLGLAPGGTFGLIELRGEFIRCLDNGRGVDAGRGVRTWQDGDNRLHSHATHEPPHGHPTYEPPHAHHAWTDVQGHHSHRMVVYKANDFNSGTHVTGTDDAWDGGSWVNAIEGSGDHGHNIGVAAAVIGVQVGASHIGIAIHADGSEARPRNVALPAWISY